MDRFWMICTEMVNVKRVRVRDEVRCYRKCDPVSEVFSVRHVSLKRCIAFGTQNRCDLSSVSHRGNTVTTNASLVEDERPGKTRWRVREHKLCPDGLDSEGQEGEVIKRDPNIRPIYECRCDERLEGEAEGSTQLAYTGLCVGLDHLKIETT